MPATSAPDVQKAVTTDVSGPEANATALWHNKFSVLSGGHFKRYC
jgi:hypothetical protein